MTSELLDTFDRPLHDLRISVTDRCNLRCSYCMPDEEYAWLARARILRFEEITRLARIASEFGVRKLRLTGGEPLLRRGLPDLVQALAELPGIEDVCLTTNAALLAPVAETLVERGVRRLNVSLDTLDPVRFQAMTRRDELRRTLDGLFAARAAGMDPIKINMVVEEGTNDDEMVAMAAFCRRHRFGLRFIEYMDVGNANGWNLERVVPCARMLETVGRVFPLRPATRAKASDPALRFEYEDGHPADLGVIASVTRPFCGNCSRARLTADGRLVTCLFASDGLDLRGPLRDGASDDHLRALLRNVWRRRSDRYSEERLTDLRRGVYRPRDRQKIEMISLGG